MKVLQVIDTLQIGGAERVAVDLANLLIKGGVSVELLLLNCTGPLEKLLDPRIRVRILQRANKYSFKKGLAAHRLCSDFDIVHVHMRHCHAYIRSVQLLFRGKYKVVLHDHYGDIGVDKTVPVSLQSILMPAYYIGVSEELCNWAEKNMKLAACFLLRNTVTSQNGLCLVNKKANKALMIANIRPAKNIEFAIDLCANSGMALDIYGNKSDLRYYEYLIEKISDNAAIRIIEGVTDFSKLYDEYSFALHTARSETGPLVLLEYMARGMPFISYKTGEVANAVAGELPLHFVDSFDTGKWQDHLSRIQREKDISTRLQNVFRSNFSSDKYLEQCLRIYREISC